MKILITGATSIIAVPLIKYLLQQNHEIYAMIRPGSANAERLKGLEHGLLKIIELDLNNSDRLPQYMETDFDVCFHFGWDGAGSENRKKREVQQKNVADSMKLLKTTAEMGCRKFLFSGSQAEYGIYEQKICETAPCHPVSEYGIAKVDFMHHVQEYLDSRKDISMEYVHARIFSVYGPEDHKGSLIDSCIDTFMSGGRIELGECSQLWNFLYIDDLTAALTALMEAENKPGTVEVYNVAGAESDTKPLKEYIDIVYKCCGCKGEYLLGRRPPNAEGTANLNPDITKIQKKTGWTPQIAFVDGINEIIKQRSK